MLEIVKEWFDSLNNAGVHYVHFKSNEHLGDAVNGKTDFDILFHPDYRCKVEEIYSELNFKRVYSSEMLSYLGVEDWLGFDYKTGSLVHIHHHYHLITGKFFVKEYEIPWRDIALKSAGFFNQEFPEIKTVSPEFEILLLLTRITLKQGKKIFIGRADRLEFDYLLPMLRENELQKYVQLCFSDLNKSDVTILIKSITENDISRKVFNVIRKYFIAHRSLMCKKKSRISCTIESYVNKFKYFSLIVLKKKFGKWDVFIKKIPNNCGKIIAFIGCDGSGKTTVSREISKWLSWKLDVGQVYLGSGENYKSLYKKLRASTVRIIRKIKQSNDQKNAKSSHKVSAVEDKIKKTLIVISMENRHKIRIARRVNRILKRINIYRMLGGIIILDRYPQLQFDGIYDGIKVDEQYRNYRAKEEKYLRQTNIIQPDMVFKLIIPVEVSLERKPDDNEQTIMRKVNITKKLIFETSKVFEINATQDYKEEILEIKRLVWEYL